jgi:hypothetical protein
VALPLDIHHAELEHNLGAALESIRPDVWLENAEGKGGAIEVFHTHAIPDEKVALYQREKIWCVELRADAILEPTPRLLVTRLWGAGSLDTRPTRCASCIRIVNEAAYGAVLDLRKIEAAYRETWDRCEVLRLKELDLKRQVAVLENALLPATKAQPFAYEPVDPYTHPAFGPRSPS